MAHTAPDYNRVHWRHSCVAVRTSAGETTIFAMHKRTFDQERRVSARRGPVNRALCGRNRVLFGGDRSDNQERRASARRADEASWRFAKTSLQQCPRLQPDYGKGHTLEGDGCSELYQACNPAMARDTPSVPAFP